jgi:small subunit ribosomal protein S20
MRAADRAALPRRSGMRPPTSQTSTPKRGFRVANIKSQIKRNKQNEKARQRNKAVKSSLKTSVRRFREAADAGDTDAAVQAMRDACRGLDKAASKGVIHKNQAANRKSAMAKRAAELQA